MAKKKQSLADYVEAAERRDAPRAQARAAGRGAWSSVWIGLMVIMVVFAAGAVAYLRVKRII
jgi:flagellar basal body-associated protein FliL